MSGERLVIILLTAHRLEYALLTARSVARNLHHDGPVHWHIASDGDEAAYIDAIVEALDRKVELTVTNSEGRGYGASYNAATQVVHDLADYILPLEDDWQLLRPLDTTPIIRMIEMGGRQPDNPWAVPPPDGFEPASVRLGYLGYRWPLRMTCFKTDETQWAALDPDSPEQHVMSGHPRIETVAYERAVGLWPEGLSAGQTELEVCGRAEARSGVVWPLSMVAVTGDLFGHIGAVQA